MKAAWALALVAAAVSASAGCAARARGPICVAGTDDTPTEQFRHDAAWVCRSVGSSDVADPRLLDSPGTAGNSFVYYVGHGHSRETESDPVLSPRPGLDVRLVSQVLSGRGLEGHWAFVATNACEIGRVDLRQMDGRRPQALLAAGYGEVATASTPDHDAPARRFANAFGDHLARALAGAADQPPVGNCDAIVTSIELANYLDDQLAQAEEAAAPPSVPAAGRPPMVILKTNSEWPLPLFRLPERSSCFDIAGPHRILQRLREANLLTDQDLERISSWRREWEASAGSNGAPLPARRRPRLLVVTGEVALASEVTAALAADGRTANEVDVVLTWRPEEASRRLGELARAVDFAEVLGLRVDGSGAGSFLLTLVDGADASLLRVGELVSDEVVATDVRDFLPQPIRLFDLPGAISSAAAGPTVRGCPDSGAQQPFLFVEVNGAVPRSVRATATAGESVTIDLFAKNVESVACPRARGQCFKVPNPGCRPRPASEYLFERPAP